MRRAGLIATFALLLALPAWGQMRGGMRGGAPGRAVGIAHAPGVGARPGFGARPSFGARPTFSFGPRITFGSNPHGVHGCFNCGFHHHHHGFHPWWWYGGYGYPYYGYGYGGYGYGGYWDSTSSYGSYDDTAYQRQYASQIDDLSQQVQQLREELDAAQYRAAQAQPQASAPAAPVPEKKAEAKKPTETDLSTVLVFRDQRIQEVKNYAIMGKTLVVVADQRQRKIPLSDLDLETTTRLNEERGVSFEIPR